MVRIVGSGQLPQIQLVTRFFDTSRQIPIRLHFVAALLSVRSGQALSPLEKARAFGMAHGERKANYFSLGCFDRSVT